MRSSSPMPRRLFPRVPRKMSLIASMPHQPWTLLFLRWETVDDAAGDGEKLPRLVAEAFQNQIRREPNRPVLRAVEVDAAAQRKDRRCVVSVEADKSRIRSGADAW